MRSDTSVAAALVTLSGLYNIQPFFSVCCRTWTHSTASYAFRPNGALSARFSLRYITGRTDLYYSGTTIFTRVDVDCIRFSTTLLKQHKELLNVEPQHFRDAWCRAVQTLLLDRRNYYVVFHANRRPAECSVTASMMWVITETEYNLMVGSLVMPAISHLCPVPAVCPPRGGLP